jgi:hypothetical protein
MAEIVALLGSADAATPSAPALLPPGRPVDAETGAAVANLVRQMEACINAGDEWRLLSIASDDEFRQMPNSPVVAAELEAMAARTSTPVAAGRRTRLLGPWHVRRLDDGRVLAAVLFSQEDETCLDLGRTKAIVFDDTPAGWRFEPMDETVWLAGFDRPGPMIDVAGPPPSSLLDAGATFCPVRDRQSDRHGRRHRATPIP